MHVVISLLVHFLRLPVGGMRFFGPTLLMLVFSLLQLAAGEPASVMLTEEENHRFTTDLFLNDVSAGICEESDPAPDSRFRRADRTDTSLPLALNKNGCSGVFRRLQPRLVMIPRMNRTPKPKSVYRSFARAPGVRVV